MPTMVELEGTVWYYFVNCAVRNKHNEQDINNLLTKMNYHNFPLYVNTCTPGRL